MGPSTRRAASAVAVIIAIVLLWQAWGETLRLFGTDVPAWIALLVAYAVGVIAGWANSTRTS